MKTRKLLAISVSVCLSASFSASSFAETTNVTPKRARLMAKVAAPLLRDAGYVVRRKGRVLKIKAAQGPIVLKMPDTIQNLDESKTTFNLERMEPPSSSKAATLADYKILQDCISSNHLLFELKLAACEIGNIQEPVKEFLCKAGPTVEAVLNQLYCIAQFDAADE